MAFAPSNCDSTTEAYKQDRNKEVSRIKPWGISWITTSENVVETQDLGCCSP